MHFSISLISPTEKKFHLVLLFSFSEISALYELRHVNNAVNSISLSQLNTFTAWGRKKKSKHCQMQHISKLQDLEWTLEVLSSDILQTKSYYSLSGHHPPGKIQNLRQEERESEPHSQRGMVKGTVTKGIQFAILISKSADGNYRSNLQMRKMGHRKSKDLFKVTQHTTGCLKMYP